MTDRERRQQILRAAARLVERYGPAKTTVADVAREARIGVGTVYLEFPSKEAIVEALSSERYTAVLEAMTRAAASAGSYAGRVCAVFDARTHTLLRLAEGGNHACDLVHCLNPAVAAAKHRFSVGEKTLLTHLLEEGARAGELSIAEPPLLASTILRAYIVFSPPWLFGLSRDEVKYGLSAMHDLVSHGLLVRAT